MQPLVNLLDALRRTTSYRAIKVDWMRVVATITALATTPTEGFVRVSEIDGKIAGCLIGTVQPLWWVAAKEGACVVSDLVFHTAKGRDGRALLRAFSEWAFKVPRVIRIEMGVSADTELKAVERFFRSQGFRREGTLFVMNHPQYQQALQARKM